MSMNNEDYTIGSAGGFINAKHAKPRVQKMKWTSDNDRKLLLIGLGKEIIPKEYAAIARMFPEKPTPKAVQERLTKLRHEQQKIIAELSLGGPITTIHSYIAGQHEFDTPMTGSSLGASTSYSGSFHLPTVSPTPDEQEVAEALMQMSRSRQTFVTPQPSHKRTRDDSEGSEISSSALEADGPSTNALTNKNIVHSDFKPRIHRIPRETKPKPKKKTKKTRPSVPPSTATASGSELREDELTPLHVLLFAHKQAKESMKRREEEVEKRAEEGSKAAREEGMAREKEHRMGWSDIVDGAGGEASEEGEEGDEVMKED